MPSYQTAEVVGAKELRRALKDAGLTLDTEIKDAHRAVGTIVKARAVELVPVAPVDMVTATPGLLRNSIRVGATKTASIVRAGGKRVPYAAPIHWGWVKRHIKPQTFLSDAAQETESKWVKEYEDKFEKILEKIKTSTQGAS